MRHCFERMFDINHVWSQRLCQPYTFMFQKMINEGGKIQWKPGGHRINTKRDSTPEDLEFEGDLHIREDVEKNIIIMSHVWTD